jgi:release factor glutamine methyltransferase
LVSDLRSEVQAIAQQLAASPVLEVRRDAAREARLLAAAVLDCAPGQLAAQLERAPTRNERLRLARASARRVRGEPLAYAVGTAAFRHLVLRVDARVLIPRPETEVVVDEALRLTAGSPGGVAVDLGTGSGAIALALATEGRFDRVIASDISIDALSVAQENYAGLTTATPVDFVLGADFAPFRGVLARVIVSNPPYIAYSEAALLPSGVRDWEPSTALFAADEGMARYEVLLRDGMDYLEPNGWLVVEVDATRARQTAARAVQRAWRQVELIKDLSGRDRVLIAQCDRGVSHSA